MRLPFSPGLIAIGIDGIWDGRITLCGSFAGMPGAIMGMFCIGATGLRMGMATIGCGGPNM